ncbi:MAG: translation initiation factor IF-2 N-terminal domain-containing protein [Acidobacteria bacterium]|nr:translation initiation factor IF-2 N-terminal domain-containing protein [Acidobacteriota bacterium]
MAKLRVYQLARELNRDNSEIIRELQHMGVPVTSHSNTVEDRLAERLRKELGVFVPEEAAKAAPVEEVIEAPKVEAGPAPPAQPAPPEPIRVEAEAPKVEVKAEPKVEPKVEEKAPAAAPPAEKVAAPAAGPAAPPAPPAPPKVEPPPPVILHTPAGGRIIPRPTVTPPPPPKMVEPPHEQRKTMQQIVQERLRQEHRLPPAPPPGQRPFDRRPGQRPLGAGQQRHPSAPGFQNRGAAPGAPAGQRPWTRPGAPPSPPTAERRPAHDRAPDRTQRYERQGEKKLDTPFVRPQPKPEVPREHRKVTLTEGLTVKELAEKLDVLAKDLQKKLMDRGVFATINQTLDKEMARGRTIKEIRGDPKTFQENIMKLKLGLEKPLPKNKIVFLDRGLPDTIAYYKFHKLKIPPKLLSMSRNRYKKIFILDMLPYHKDYARIEDVKDAKKIHKMIMKSYKELGYKLVKIPVMPVEKRVEKILKSVKE